MRLVPLRTATAATALALAVGLLSAPPAASAQQPVGDTTVASTATSATVTRAAGQSRYETAVELSRRLGPGQNAVFVATGADFPDALSAAAAAGSVGGPVLLTPSSWIQDTVMAEIRRLAPDTIYVLGGPLVVSESVSAKLATIAPVERIHGINRYETSRKIVSRFFPSSTEMILATGRGYADALAAGAAAGARKIPALLVDGDKATLDTATTRLIHSSGARTIWLAGGHGAVSIGIEQQLRTAGFSVRRYGGATRYDTAAAITAAFRASEPATIFVTTGQDFPDALAAAAVAAQTGAALYLSRATCVPLAARTAIAAASTVPRVVVGGAAVVSDAAARNTSCGDTAPPAPSWATTHWTFSTTTEAPYLDRPPVNVHDPGIVLDATGLRVMNFGPGGTRADHPVAYAQYGLSALIEYQNTGNAVWLDRALRHAQRLVEIHTDRGDAWHFPYLFDWRNANGQTLKAPWWSAMSQGEALSLFVRLFEETGDASWRTAADHTWAGLQQPRAVAEPWTTVTDQNLLWFEEYAGNLPPLRVLNGHIFALFGVYDYWKLTGDSTARRYLDGAATSVLTVMPKIRIPGQVSYYCWATECRSPAWQNWRYHGIHSWQLDTLARLTGDSRFTDWSNLLRRDWSQNARLREEYFEPDPLTFVAE